jgi:hypothetical protein
LTRRNCASSRVSVLLFQTSGLVKIVDDHENYGWRQPDYGKRLRWLNQAPSLGEDCRTPFSSVTAPDGCPWQEYLHGGMRTHLGTS